MNIVAQWKIILSNLYDNWKLSRNSEQRGKERERVTKEIAFELIKLSLNSKAMMKTVRRASSEKVAKSRLICFAGVIQFAAKYDHDMSEEMRCDDALIICLCQNDEHFLRFLFEFQHEKLAAADCSDMYFDGRKSENF